MNGNKKNIGKRTEQKRRPGGAGEGSAGEKAEQKSLDRLNRDIEGLVRMTGNQVGNSGNKPAGFSGRLIS